MFLGREQEAQALYLAHKGERLSEDGDRLQDRAIADDFAQFREARVTHPARQS